MEDWFYRLISSKGYPRLLPLVLQVREGFDKRV